MSHRHKGRTWYDLYDDDELVCEECCRHRPGYSVAYVPGMYDILGMREAVKAAEAKEKKEHEEREKALAEQRRHKAATYIQKVARGDMAREAIWWAPW